MLGRKLFISSLSASWRISCHWLPVCIVRSSKPTLNVYDPDSMKRLAAAPWVLVAEGYNVKTGLGSRFGSALLKAGFKGKYNNIGTHKEGCGGLWEQMPWQGLDSVGIQKAAKALAV